MFKKILIANRGEIAVRVIRTARQMGIETVAVYSEADAEALHVRMADEAVAIGPAASAESYLVADKIVEACKTTGAEAVHPGYGFLSENAAFATALEKAGIAFIGPNVEAIKAMGDKIESKKLAEKAKVNTVPGHIGVIEDDKEAVKIAGEIGYPVMIKASAGGGGKGMRIAWSEKEVRDGFRSAKSEAKSSFADDRVFIEKFVEEPRHIEIQVLADSHGNTLYLGERECSIQRRHQKVIEEAPSPFLDAATRKAMGEQAVALAKAVGYRSAGTVEFIVDKDRNFYFLEMNTRLQVEHPVTEMVTGLDLVEQMIRIAAGEKLGIKQSDVKLKGWAMECRVYAEDPLRNFLPSIGRLVRYIPPDMDDVRIDSGVEEGAEISMFYDPMISKLITWGEDRNAAIELMGEALNAYYVRGVAHNMTFLAAIMDHSRFRDGRLSTNFIPEEFPDGFSDQTPDRADLGYLLAAAGAIQLHVRERDLSISGQIDGQQLFRRSAWHLKLGNDAYEITVEGEPGDCQVSFALDGKEHVFTVIDAWRLGEPLFRAEINGKQVCIQTDRNGVSWTLGFGGVRLDCLIMTPKTAALAAQMPHREPPDLSKMVLSPMPGLLVSLAVEEGQEIKAGEEVCVVEAMKMENILRAEVDGVVKSILAVPGDSLTVDQVIVEFE